MRLLALSLATWVALTAGAAPAQAPAPAGPDPTCPAALAALPAVLASWGPGARRQLTRAELQPDLLAVWQQLAAAAGAAPDRDRFRAEARRLAEATVNRRLLLELAAADGIRPDLEAAAATLNHERDPAAAPAPPEPEAVRLQADATAIDRWVVDRILPTVAVAAADLEAYYQAHRDEFAAPEAVRAAAILLPLPAAATAAERQRVRDQAENLRRQLAAGADFAAVAREHNPAPGADAAGDLGYIPKGAGDPLAAAVFKLKDGEVSPVVEAPPGLLILKRTGWRPAGSQPLDAGLRAELTLALQAERGREAFQRRLAAYQQAQQLTWGF